MSNRLVENILKSIAIKLFYSFWQPSNDLSNKWFTLIWLYDSELLRSAFADLQESITGHFHNTWKLFLHEFKQFFYNSLQEGPITSQKSRILAHNIHDAWGNDGFILFSFFDITQLQQSSKRIDEENSLFFLLNTSAEWANYPWKWVQGIKAKIHALLFLDFLEDELSHIFPVVSD